MEQIGTVAAAIGPVLGNIVKAGHDEPSGIEAEEAAEIERAHPMSLPKGGIFITFWRIIQFPIPSGGGQGVGFCPRKP